MSPPLFYAVDASIFIFRAYFSLPPRWQADNGFDTQALYGYANFLLRLLRQERPEWLACAFDESLGSGFRHRLCPEYKANRVLPDEALAYQLNACRELTALFGICDLASEEFEADDLIASLACAGRRQGHAIYVLSRDKDLSQVLGSPLDRFWDFPDGTCLDANGIVERFGVGPTLIPELLALVGDPVDAIVGVAGIGKKTAVRLLNEFGSCEAILSDLDGVANSGIRGARGLAERLSGAGDQIALALKLTRLREDALGEDFALPRWRPDCVDRAELDRFLDRNGLGQLAARCHELFEATG